MVNIIKSKLFEEIVFFVSLGLAVFTGFFAVFHIEAIDFNVIGILVTLMLISLTFEKYHLLDYLAVAVLNRADSERKTAIFMILLTAVLGMLITNDVALITVVPITISMSKKVGINPYKLIVLEALSANIGSSLTPFGNPQNLFLYNFFKFDFFAFLYSVSIFVIVGLLLLVVPVLFLD
ncbi:MAG TPA: anion transporter, partial [Clostridiales bacterium UBA8960]|nr:anion transporter [Clostridiales bacterium UBA8960]